MWSGLRRHRRAVAHATRVADGTEVTYRVSPFGNAASACWEHQKEVISLNLTVSVSRGFGKKLTAAESIMIT
jgi:hypothetical protein